MEKLTIVWNDKVLYWLNDLWGAIVFWRSLSLALLAVVIFAFMFKESIKRMLLNDDANKHDKEMFRIFDLLMSKVKLFDILDSLEKKHFYDSKSREYINMFIESLSEESRQYINNKIKRAAVALCFSLKCLVSFIDKNFVIFPGGQDNISADGMYPNPKIDGGGNEDQKNTRAFAEFDEELKLLVSSAKNKYQKYRIQIKQNLQI